MHDIPWLKSSYSGNTGNCVEVAFAGRVVAVRDSKDPAARNWRSRRMSGAHSR